MFVNNNTLAADFRYTPTGTRTRYFKKLAGISFPGNKQVSILYHRLYTYDGKDSVIDKIKISDSVFRYGYLFKWFTPEVGMDYTLLNGLQKYTSTETIPAYQFSYYGPYFKPVGSAGDTFFNKRDHWGFYNKADNGINVIPTVPGIYNGANRTASPISSRASTLFSIADPSGSTTRYLYESNDVCDYAYVQQNATITDARVNAQTTITCSQAQNNLHTLKFSVPDYLTLFAPTFSGTCNLTILVTSTDGLTTYGSFATSLSELFQLGSLNFSFNGPNAQYKVSTSMPAGCTAPAAVPLNISWLNQSFLANSVISGGIRIKQQLSYDPVTQKWDTVATYNYLTADGKSSGFLGALPKYDYPYQRTVVNGLATTTYYTAISSDPVKNTQYTQGSPVGYSRVVVYKGTSSRNLGREVYEFTTLQDANTSNAPALFPYPPLVQRDWALGLPKRITTYDSLGNLVKVKRNTYDITTVAYNNSQFQSVKQGRFSITYNGDPNLESTPRTELYVAQGYFPESGRVNLVASVDSLYHPNGSIQVAEQTMQYDTSYNLVKVTTPYNKTRSLSLEKRLYYPYHYTLTSGAIKKMKDSSIISAQVSAESWIVGDANPRMLQAGITDYQQLPQGYIRPLTVYALQSNAPVAQSVIGAFNPASLVRNSTWLVAQQNFLTYDTKGNLLESKNALSGERSALVMDYANQFAIARVANTPYTDMAYTSFESDGTGNWTIGSTNRDYSSSVTGNRSYQLSGGAISKSGLTASRIYLVFLWAKAGASVSVNGTGVGTALATQNGWNLYQASVTGATTITISGTGLIDELRLHPREANMATTTYDPVLGITSAADANNTISYYAYDKIGRLQALRDKDLNILRKYEYGNNPIAINNNPDWQNQGTECQIPLNGKVDRIEQDMNPYSDTYNTIRKILDHNDCVTCAPTCTSPPEKLINCQCETGILVVGASLWTKETGVWKWKCTLYWKYSDCSLVYAWVEYRDTACPVNAACD
ncbi:hypothetical protein [Paraflavitalea speifideaquila]|uniref:hypothetical protein n=1 Tax=Paraflavitalea speifideaquila TaxID=3076558 RepID=UPI0028EB0D36|nr:hypothetical protein [Paraflavitalea speifideiaquila]